MSPIPVYSHGPTNAAKVDGETTKTVTPSTTNASTANVPSAKPGASVIPAPTPAVQMCISLQPTPVLKTADDKPPAPQPGTFPTPTNGRNSYITPPPKADKTSQPLQTAADASQGFPSQMRLPSPPKAIGAQTPGFYTFNKS